MILPDAARDSAGRTLPLLLPRHAAYAFAVAAAIIYFISLRCVAMPLLFHAMLRAMIRHCRLAPRCCCHFCHYFMPSPYMPPFSRHYFRHFTLVA